MATIPLFICQDYSKLVSCYCNIYGLGNKIPRELQGEWKKFSHEDIIGLSELLQRIAKLLGIELKEPKENPCEVMRQVVDQIKRICEKLKKTEKINAELKELLTVTEKILASFENKMKSFLAKLHKLGLDPCEYDGNGDHGGVTDIDTKPFEDVKEEVVDSSDIQLQSKYIYLQASGSDGSDGTSDGIHLRWTFRDKLAEEHLPKGSLASSPGSPFATSIGHNRPDDYVYIKRIAYHEGRAPGVDFNSPPGSVNSTGWKREWTYTVPGFSSMPVIITVRFMNYQKYDSIGIDPLIKTLDFIKSYDDLLEVQVDNGLLFSVEFTLAKRPGGCNPFNSFLDPPPAKLMFEFISVPYEGMGAPKSISCREITTHNDVKTPLVKKHFCENILYIRFRTEHGYVTKIKLETYLDYFNSIKTWDNIGKFSLTALNTKADKRLEDTARFCIDKRWPQYNDGTTVKAKNYSSKWSDPQNGIEQAVKEYLWLSKTDIYAITVLNSSQPGDTAQFPVSYISLLNMAGSDYHIARMLGLGHIDTPTSSKDARYIYIATYATKNKVLGEKTGPGQLEYTMQAYMSLPTDRKDFRLPETPELVPVSYGLNIEGSIASQLFDEAGYSTLYDLRFIRLARKKYDFEITFQNFFQDTTQFCTCEKTYAILYGIEYKKQGASDYVKPEITSRLIGPQPIPIVEYYAYDTDFPVDGVLETVPVKDDESTIFVHSETEEGFHCYSLYGINWFSRPSALSNESCTDETKFPKKNTLLPPSNVGVQYIQEEDPLIFTSLVEQQALAAREAATPGADNCVTRVTLNYHLVHNIAYQRGNELHFYFRENAPAEVKGNIVSVSSGSGPNLARIVTGSYTNVDTGILQTPFIPVSNISNFIGSIFVCEGDQYIIVSMQSDPAGAIFEVEMIPTTVIHEEQETDPITGNIITSYTNTYGLPKSPQPGQRFTVVENLSVPARWTKLSRTEQIVHFSSYTEDRVLNDGTIIPDTIGGIFGSATIDASTSIAGIEGVTGVFRVIFSTEILVNHPGGVEWCMGIARIITSTGKMKLCEVVKIETQSPLKIWIYDSAPADDPILTGANRDVNFHPGYRLYLSPEPAVNFDRTHILPATENTKKTFIGVQSVDTTMSPDYESAVSTPVVLLAQKIQVPVPPAIPAGPTFATRPDFYGKSTYTFDAEINTSGGRSPFSLIFYRADDEAILDALYARGTMVTIRQDLAALDPNDFSVNRFSDLANSILDNAPAHQGKFKEYDGYRFPNPDKPGLLTGSETVPQKAAKIKIAVDKVFVPLTKNPPVYEFIKTGRQTEGVAPVLYDSSGNLLAFNHVDFNPFPMARKYTDNGRTYVRFTDYTLDGTSINMFFYYAVEMSSQLKLSDRSPVSGPIMLVNAFPPESPVIKTVFPKPADPSTGSPATVFFTMEPYLESERITHVKIFRSTDADSVLSVRNMTLVKECSLDQVYDAFADIDFPPYGEVVYYRLVALRTIINEKGNEERIPSKPSPPFITNLIDTVNPESPVMKHSLVSMDVYRNLNEVTLKWAPTCYNGTYHLYRQSNKGNWEKIYSVKSNSPMTYPPIGDFVTYAETKILPKLNEDGKIIYHRFKIGVENASGLINTKDKEYTI